MGKKIPVVVWTEADGSETSFPLVNRWRKSGGRVTHAASVSAEDERGGRYTIVACDDDILHWTNAETIERLGLLLDDEEEVTCKACNRIIERLLSEAEDAG